jgi:hypothetical protein
LMVEWRADYCCQATGPKTILFAARNGCWGVHETTRPDKGDQVCQLAGRRIR